MRFTRTESEETRMTKRIINGSELINMKFEVREDGTLKRVDEGKFLPELGEELYFVDRFGCVNSITFYNIDRFSWFLKHNLVFRTKEECKEYRSFFDLLDEYTFEPDWEDVESRKYHIIYNHDTNEFDCDVEFAMQYHKHFFETLEKLNEFIEKAGKQNIKRFMFDIWD